MIEYDSLLMSGLADVVSWLHTQWSLVEDPKLTVPFE